VTGPPIVIYRGQKEWSDGMTITASSLRRSSFVPDPVVWTDQLLGIIDNLRASAASGNARARKQLTDQLLYAQQEAHQNPFVSCSRKFSIAQGFALHGDTPGYILTISGDEDAGLDFEAVRTQFGLFGDSMDYLEEYGLPRSLNWPFQITQVELVGPHAGPGMVVYP
jgi:hypothetical protein